MDGLVALSLKVLNQSSRVLVFGDDQSKLLRVFEREVDMPRPAMEVMSAIKVSRSLGCRARFSSRTVIAFAVWPAECSDPALIFASSERVWVKAAPLG
jgi:hypothetical protein